MSSCIYCLSHLDSYSKRVLKINLYETNSLRLEHENIFIIPSYLNVSWAVYKSLYRFIFHFKALKLLLHFFFEFFLNYLSIFIMLIFKSWFLFPNNSASFSNKKIIIYKFILTCILMFSWWYQLLYQ